MLFWRQRRRLQGSIARPASQTKWQAVQRQRLARWVLKMHLVVEHRKELANQSLRLGSHEVELNRIDTAFVAAAK